MALLPRGGVGPRVRCHVALVAAWFVGRGAALSVVQRQPSSSLERRVVLAAPAALTLSLLPALPAVADVDTTRLKTGYDGIEYLLSNWDAETFKSCPKEQIALAAECDRLPDKIPTALGLRSTTAPLYKVEKIFSAALQSGSVEDIDTWTEATDSYIQHSTSAQEYAYTASFGEYNPSGGKDQVAKYMDLSRNELKLARDALKQVLLQLGYDV